MKEINSKYRCRREQQETIRKHQLTDIKLTDVVLIRQRAVFFHCPVQTSQRVTQ